MRAVKAVFKNGVFVPLEHVELDEGSEALVVFQESKAENELPQWWDKIEADDFFKQALNSFVNAIRGKVPFRQVKLLNTETGKEIIVVVDSGESDILKVVMEEAFKLFQEFDVFLPIQVISVSRLNKWRERNAKIYRDFIDGTPIA